MNPKTLLVVPSSSTTAVLSFSQRLSSLLHLTAKTIAPPSPPFMPPEVWIGICCHAVHCYPCLRSPPATVSLAASTPPGSGGGKGGPN
ncbi:hypothetical protein PIB30_069722, partial [Stylosanthes scabra]|nr:hypothetical protein [Stylosanthes scabra]